MLSKKAIKNPFVKKYGDTSNIPQPDINERFVDACENGDCATVTTILQSIKDFSIEVTDNLGRTALRLAVENEHLEVVQELLAKSDSQKIRDALLLAIFLGHTQIAEAILKHPKYKILNEKKFLNGDTDSFWQTPSSDDAQFSPDITPIMLASQYNRTEIVQMLLLNGDRISKPHDFNCKCTECLNKFKFDSLRHAQSRLNAYKGLASESYISLASIDPILTAFELGRELEILAEKEKYFKNEYLQLRHSLSIYSVKLLNNVRGRDELEIVLNKTGKEREEKYERLARLDLALKYQEKPFVAHSNCQQKLVEIWYSGVRKISKMNPIIIFILVVMHILLLPISSIFYIIAPKSKVGQFMSLPSVKFISHFVSYSIFVVLIFVSNFQFSVEELGLQQFSVTYGLYSANYTTFYQEDMKRHIFKDFRIRPYKPSQIEIAISVWLIGQTWHEIKQIFKSGIYGYLYSSTNIVNFCMNVLYLASYGLKYHTMLIVSSNVEKINSPEFWNKIANFEEASYEEKTELLDTFYWLNSDRYYWKSFDPINLSEGLFALASVLLFGRLCFYLPVNQQLGPLQITLGKMIFDIVKFICIFLIVFTAFVFSLNNLYLYYATAVRSKIELKAPFSLEAEEANKNPFVLPAEQAFGSLINAFKTLFFSTYLIGDSEAVAIIPFDNSLTLGFGYFLYATFQIGIVTILMSMLIAMMTKSYENIIHHSDIEWKFARSKLYMEYIKEGFTLPVPLNLLPTPVSTYNSIRKYIKKYKERKAKVEPESDLSMSKMSKKSVNTIAYANEEQPSMCDVRSQNSAGHLPNGRSSLNGTGVGVGNGKLSRMENGVSNSKFKKGDLESIPEVPNGTAEPNLSYAPDNQKLTYRIVMERVVKRFLMHNQGDSDDPKQNEFDDLKQDLQMMRYEMLNDLKKSREDNMRNMFVINGGIQFLAEEILTNSVNKEGLNSAILRYKELLSHSASSVQSAEGDVEKYVLGTTAVYQQFKRQSSDNFDKISMPLIEDPLKLPPSSIELERVVPDNIKPAFKQTTVVTEAEMAGTPPGLSKWQSTDDFFQTRLAYDFQTIHEEE